MPATYDYSQFYKTKSPTGYDIFRSGGQKLSYEEATPMFQSGFNVAFIGERPGAPQSGGTGAGVPIGQSAAVSAKQAGLPGVPTGGVAGAPTFGQPAQPTQLPISQPPTTPVNISVSPEIDSDSLSVNNYRTGLNALLEENKKARESIMQQQEEARRQLLTSQQPTEQEYGIQSELSQLESGLSRLANQERKMDFGFLPEEYLKTEKGLQDVGISEAQLQRRIATEQAPIKRSFTDQRLDTLAQVESRQKALGLETGKRQGLYERAKTALGFAESDMNRIDKMMENQMQIEGNILDYAFKLDERSRQGLGTILKAFEGATQSFDQMSPQSQQGVLSMARQFGIDPNAVIAGIDSQVDGNMLGQAKTMLDMKKTQAEIEKFKEEKRQFGMTYALAQQKVAMEAVNIQGANEISSNLAAYGQRIVSEGKLPSPAELKASGLTVGEVSEYAKSLPKPKGALVSIATGVTPNNLSALQVQGITAMNEVVGDTLPRLKELFPKLYTGVIGGVAGAIHTTQDRQDYNTFKQEFLSKLLVARSGAAVTEQEYARYAKMLPGTFNQMLFLGSDGLKKLNALDKSMNVNLKNILSTTQTSVYGYTKTKLNGDPSGQEYTVGDVIDINGIQASVLPDGTLAVQ